MIKKFLFIIIGMANILHATSLPECVHLLDRTSFGVERASLDACLDDPSYERSVERLLQSSSASTEELLPECAREILRPHKRLRELNATELKAFRQLRQKRFRQTKLWWIRQLLKTGNPFRERMVLFWHNHFTSSLKKVGQPKLILRQNQLFRRYALGNFRLLLHAIVEDPAMLVYLDNRANRKRHPNENLARELLELFTLGEGHYREADVKALARALTGYTLDRQMHFRFNRRIHDTNPKAFLGQRGNFDAHQAVEIILEQNATARFIVGKLWKAFVGPEPEAGEIRRLAEIFRNSGYEMKPLLEAMFRSRPFTDPARYGTMVKSPLELVVGTLRSFGRKDFDPRIVLQYSRRLGQDPFDPPNVKGWEGGDAWIDANTLLIRKEFLARLIRGKGKLMQLDETIFNNRRIADTKEEAAARMLLPVRVFLTPASRFDATLEALLQHPLYQLK